MAGLAAAYGWVTLERGPFPRWTGWCAVVGAAGLVVSRYLWFVSGVWFPAYALFWVWLVARPCAWCAGRRSCCGRCPTGDDSPRW